MKLGLFLRGVAMGLAEVVPGVSGGTIAFVTGIYDQLLESLSRLDWRCIAVLKQSGLPALWQHVNGTFLLLLGVGMLLSIVLFSRFMHYALESHAPLVWGFFSGVILFSIVEIARTLPLKVLLWALPLGALVGFGAASLPAGSTAATLPWVFLGGAIAISAWMLPAVSGSFMLLVLGLYEPIIEALATLHWPTLAALAAGCVLGLVLFAKVLRYALLRFRQPLLGYLTGFMVGALPRLWPWQVDGQRFSPDAYAVVTADAPTLPLVIGMLICGAFLLWLLTRVRT